ncbi:MAG: hypothetical protein NVSMB13_19650 [Mycobacteriales bacterium]
MTDQGDVANLLGAGSLAGPGICARGTTTPLRSQRHQGTSSSGPATLALSGFAGKGLVGLTRRYPGRTGSAAAVRRPRTPDRMDMLGLVRAPLARLLMPVGRALANAGVSPDVITIIGTLGVSAGALAFYPRGSFFVGTLVITAFVFSDMLDGAVARASGAAGSTWGAFLDSSLDRVADAAVFVAIALWYAGRGHDLLLCALALYCLVSGLLTSYVKARAEGLGLRCDVGIAERSERLIVVLAGCGLSGLLGLPVIRIVALWLLAAASTVTVGQRLVAVRRQTTAALP